MSATSCRPLARTVTREDVRAYADAGGDQNPLHQDDDVARMAGFPGIIAHGMFTMGHLAACVAAWAGDPANVTRLSRSSARPCSWARRSSRGAAFERSTRTTRTVVVELWVTVERDGATEFADPQGRGGGSLRRASGG